MIKFYRAKDLPDSVNSSHDGIWFVKKNGLIPFEIVMVKSGTPYYLKIPSLDEVLSIGNITTKTIEASKFITTSGTSSQFVKGDGSLDGNSYALAGSLGNYVPYTGANQAVDLNTQNFTIGGDFEKIDTTFEKRYLIASTTSNLHFTRLTDVASFSKGNDSTTQFDCIVITLPIRTTTRWVMEVDIFRSAGNGIFRGTPTKLLISAYATDNRIVSVTAISNADNVKSVSFCRDSNNNTVIIIRPSDGVGNTFAYGKVNIANFYHSTTYDSDLEDKSNYSVTAELESDLIGLTTNETITNAQFTRDSYLWNKGDFTQNDINNWNTAHGWGNHSNVGYALSSWVSANFDKYSSWNLKVAGNSRKSVGSNDFVDFVAGNHIEIEYENNGKVRISGKETSFTLQDLQSVTEEGNSTTKAIIHDSGLNEGGGYAHMEAKGFLHQIGEVIGEFSNTSVRLSSSVGKGVSLEFDGFRLFYPGLGSPLGYIYFPTDFEGSDATLPISVNGVKADPETGNIDLDIGIIEIIEIDGGLCHILSDKRVLRYINKSATSICINASASDINKEIILTNYGTTTPVSVSSSDFRIKPKDMLPMAAPLSNINGNSWYRFKVQEYNSDYYFLMVEKGSL